ncbi:hypothetical protein TNIN_67611 [Trichonephila inaurata madagascariensis]|uniref:Uncharacterized protein n=1 Tax=Trichonephila inaurata madagascariensis TaxID=2747483 RepID=A0A8X6IGT9_9ARAC|nr:hypothetical protein TNIN_67611 [Trichonephila inaurata madagascariensis]
MLIIKSIIFENGNGAYLKSYLIDSLTAIDRQRDDASATPRAEQPSFVSSTTSFPVSQRSGIESSGIKISSSSQNLQGGASYYSGSHLSSPIFKNVFGNPLAARLPARSTIAPALLIVHSRWRPPEERSLALVFILPLSMEQDHAAHHQKLQLHSSDPSQNEEKKNRTFPRKNCRRTRNKSVFVRKLLSAIGVSDPSL